MHDSGTDILNKLGVLDSKIVSPNEKLHPVVRESRSSHAERGSVSGDSVNLLPETNLELGETLSNAQTSCYNVQSVIFYGFIYCYAIAFGILYLSSGRFTEQDAVNMSRLFLLALGIPIGFQLVGFLFLRVQMMTSMVTSILTAIVTSMLCDASGSFSNLSYVILGSTLGMFERNVYLFINEQWPKSWRRRLSIAYIIFFLGLLSVALTIQHDNVTSTRRVREVISSNESVHPTKPISAIGISEDQERMTPENAAKRKLAELKKLDEGNINCTNVTLPGCSTVNLPSGTLPDILKTENSISGKSTYALDVINRGRNRISEIKKEVLEKLEPNITLKNSSHPYTFNIAFMNLGIFATLFVVSLFTDISPTKHIFEPHVVDSLIDSTSTMTVVILSCSVSFLLELLCFAYLPLIAAVHIHQYRFIDFHTTTWSLIFGIPLVGRLVITMMIKRLSSQLIFWIVLLGAVASHAVLVMGSMTANTICNSAVIMVFVAMLPCELYGFQQEELASSPFVISKRISCGRIVGRIIGSFMFSKSFKLNAPDFLYFIQFGLILLCILFFGLYKATNLAIRQHRILSFTDAISRGDVEAVQSSAPFTDKTNGTYSRLDGEDSDNCLLSDFSDVDDW